MQSGSLALHGAAASVDEWRTSFHETLNSLFGLLNERWSEESLFVWGSVALHMVLFWGYSLVFLLPDLFGWPKFFQKFKVQPDVSPVREDHARYLRTVAQVLFNQLVVGPVVVYGAYVLAKARGATSAAPVPSAGTAVRDLAVYLLVEEVLFYYGHRLLHHRAIYRFVHKQHHLYQAPIAVAAVYAHPVEHVLANMLPVCAGPVLMGSHLATVWLWQSLAVLNSVSVHSGYHFPFPFPDPQKHDFHHLKFDCQFGILGILDYLHGTTGNFAAHLQKRQPDPWRPLTGGSSLYM